MSQSPDIATFVVFTDGRRAGEGPLADVAGAAWRAQHGAPQSAVTVFDRVTGAVVDLDLHGDEAAVAARYRPRATVQPRGRPRLGVVAREVTLLPRHWDWLGAQPGGASAALRRLIDAARHADDGATDARRRAEAAYRFMHATAGDRPGFEDASRALFAGDHERLSALIAAWPKDLREETMRFLAS
jgi:hypothetical protein